MDGRTDVTTPKAVCFFSQFCKRAYKTAQDAGIKGEFEQRERERKNKGKYCLKWAGSIVCGRGGG